MVTAGDIALGHDVEIINPNHVIAHLTKGAQLSMTLKIAKGRGYQPASGRRSEEERPIGSLLLDASFNPVQRVAYTVESARVEQRTDLDKLIIELETNGTVDPEDTIRRAANDAKVADVRHRFRLIDQAISGDDAAYAKLLQRYNFKQIVKLTDRVFFKGKVFARRARQYY